MAAINRTGIEAVQEIHLSRRRRFDTDPWEYFVDVRYRVLTDDGDPIERGRQLGPLVGPPKTRAENIFTSVEAAVTAKEGL